MKKKMLLPKLLAAAALCVTPFCLRAGPLSPEPVKLGWQECVSLAIQHNPDVKLARLKTEEVGVSILQGCSPFLPQIQAGYAPFPPTAGVSAVQPIFSVSIIPSLAKMKIARDSAKVNLQLALLEMVYQVRTAFAAALYAQELEKIHMKEADLVMQRARRAPSLFEAGKISKSQMKMMEVNASLVEDRKNQMVNDRKRRMLELCEVLGAPASFADGREVEGTLPQKAPQNLDEEHLAKRAIERRLDLRLIKNSKLLADEEVWVQASPLFPTLGVGGGVMVTAKPPSYTNPIRQTLDAKYMPPPEDDPDYTFTGVGFGAQATWRIIDTSGETWRQIRNARDEVVKREIVVQRLEREIPKQVGQAVSALKSIRDLLATMDEKEFVEAERGMALLQREFDAGHISQLDVLDAQEQYVRLHAGRLQIHYNLELALAALDRATGDRVLILEQQALTNSLKPSK